jgi:hypothetical protein
VAESSLNIKVRYDPSLVALVLRASDILAHSSSTGLMELVGERLLSSSRFLDCSSMETGRKSGRMLVHLNPYAELVLLDVCDLVSNESMSAYQKYSVLESTLKLGGY